MSEIVRGSFLCFISTSTVLRENGLQQFADGMESKGLSRCA
jgi:hypothetical protein